MAFRFILGRSGSGKTHHCLQRIMAALAEGEEGPPLVWLVPEQATYQAERSVLADPRVAGFSRLRVLSFNRLSFFLLGQTPGCRELTSIGRKVLLSRILNHCHDRLQILSNSANQPGLAADVARAITECQHQNCQSDDLAAAAKKLAPETPTRLKLQDLATILALYEQAMAERGAVLIDPGWDLHRAQKSLAHTDWLQGAHLWIDGFTGFTGQEWGILTEILRSAANTEVALCLDPQILNLDCRNPAQLDPESLFSQTEELYVALAGLCERLDILLENPILLNHSQRFQTPALKCIEADLYNPKRGTDAKTPWKAMEVVAAPNARTEIEHVARRIGMLVRERGYRYHDIAVIIPDLEGYQAYIDAAFSDENIPYFLDRAYSLSHHPLIELIRAALRIVTDGFHSSDVMALLKTDLGPLSREECDALENYVLAVGIKGRDWTNAEAWQHGHTVDASLDDQTMEALRTRISHPLLNLSRAWSRTRLMAADFVRALWDFLITLKVPDTLGDWARAHPNLEHGQALDKVVDLLDQLVLVLGNESLSLTDLGSALKQALGELTITRIPPTLDQVLVGTIERSRHPDLRAAFLVGVTQGQFPLPLQFDTLLTDPDRAAANEMGLPLNPPVLTGLVQRQYLAYIALTRASEFLSLSYPAMDRAGSVQEPAPVINELKTLFPGLTVTSAVQTRLQLVQPTSPAGLADALSQNLTDPESTGQSAQLITALANQDNGVLKQVGQSLYRALTYTNEAKIPVGLTHRFVGEHLVCSATAMETFAACPYRYFASKMLRLKPRRPLGFDALDAGDLYHRALDRLFRQLQVQELSIRNLDEKTRNAAVEETFDTVLNGDPRLQSFMARDAFHRYRVERLARSLRDCVRDLAAMMQAGQFNPVATEISFEEGGALPALSFKLDGGCKLILIGRIDRVDLSGDTALVFDYKKGAASARFDLGRWYHGLSLQTALYTLVMQDVSLAGKPVRSCAGAFLIPVEASAPSRRYGEAEKDTFPRKANGLFEGSRALDLDASPGRWGSRYYNFAMKGGEPYGREARSSAYRPESYQRILTHTKALIKGLGQRMWDGQIDVAPYSLGSESPCSFCDYAALCKFDWQITPPRLLPKLKRPEVLRVLEETYA